MQELNFSFLLTVFKKNWWKIVAFTLVVMLATALVTQFFIPKKYSSSVKFYVVNVDSDQDYASATNLAAAEYLANDYIEIINGDTLLSTVADRLVSEGYINTTPNMLRQMIKSSVKPSTSVFTVSVSHTNKEFAYRTAQLLEEIAPPIITDIAKPADTTGKRAAANVRTLLRSLVDSKELSLTWIDPETGKEAVNTIPSEMMILEHLEYHGEATERLSCIAVLKSPVKATSHDSPSLLLNTVVSGVIAAVLSYSFFLIISSINSTVVTEDDVRSMIKKPMMSAIPHWETTQKK